MLGSLTYMFAFVLPTVIDVDNDDDSIGEQLGYHI